MFLWHRQLAHVVQECRRFDGANQLLVCHPNTAGQSHRAVLNAADVAMRNLVLRVDRHRESLDRGKVEAIELSQVRVGVIDTPHSCAERQIHHHQ